MQKGTSNGTVTDIDGTNTSTLKLATNNDAVRYFDDRARQFQISKAKGIGDAKDELYAETEASVLSVFEVNCTQGKRPLVAIINGGGYVFYDVCSDDNAPITKAEDPDRVYFANVTGGSPQFGGTEAHKTEVNNKLSKFMAAWFHADGFYLVRETGDDGNNYLCLLSATTNSWFKIKQTK